MAFVSHPRKRVSPREVLPKALGLESLELTQFAEAAMISFLQRCVAFSLITRHIACAAA